MLMTIKSLGKLSSHYLEIKSSTKSHIAFIEGNNVVTDDKVLTKFFVNVIATLGIKYEKLLSNYNDDNYNLDEFITR